MPSDLPAPARTPFLEQTLSQPPLQLAIPNPGVHMTIGIRTLQRLRGKVARCKEHDRDFKSWAYLTLGIAVPCALSAYSDFGQATPVYGPNLGAAAFFGLSGLFLLILDRVKKDAKIATIDMALEDFDDLVAGIDPSITVSFETSVRRQS